GSYRYDNDTWSLGSGGTAPSQNSADGIPAIMEVSSNGLPTASNLTNGGLIAATTMAYDELGRSFKTTTYSVDPSTHTFSTVSTYTIVSQSWFDQRGETLASYTSGGAMRKMNYDGAGRMTISYTTDGGAVGNSGTIRGTWADANSVSNDIVLSQIEYFYD